MDLTRFDSVRGIVDVVIDLGILSLWLRVLAFWQLAELHRARPQRTLSVEESSDSYHNV